MIGVHARSKIGGFQKRASRAGETLIFMTHMLPRQSPRWPQEWQKGFKRGSIRAGFPIGNPKNAHKSRVFYEVFEHGAF